MFASQNHEKLFPWVSSLVVLLLAAGLACAYAAHETLVPTGSIWKYLADGSDQGTAWQRPGFDDTTWASGAGPLGFGDSHIVTVLPSGFITYYFRHTFSVADPSAFASARIRLLRDDGAIVYLNGVEVFRSNMPGGAVTSSTLATSSVGGTDETAYFEAITSPHLLNSGANQLAVEVHQSSLSSSDLGFDLALIAEKVPMVVSATSDCSTEVVVTFNIPVDPSTSQDGFNYFVSGGDGSAQVSHVSAGPNDQTVVITLFEPLLANQSYALHSCCICDSENGFNCSPEQQTPITLDSTPPTVNCSVAVRTLFPPNGKLVNVGLNAASSDPDLQVQVFSDEPGPDAQFSNGTLMLRASRDDAADGRVYLVVVSSADACGNVGVCCTTVVVPHNASAAALASVQAQGAAAEAQCSASGSPPTPYQLLP